MTESNPTPVIKRATDVEYEPVSAADGLSKGVLIDDADGAPNFAIRRFTLEPGASVVNIDRVGSRSVLTSSASP